MTTPPLLDTRAWLWWLDGTGTLRSAERREPFQVNGAVAVRPRRLSASSALVADARCPLAATPGFDARHYRLRCAGPVTITPIVARTSASASLPIAALDVLLRCGSQVDLDTAEPNARDQRLAMAFCLQLDQPKVREEHHDWLAVACLPHSEQRAIRNTCGRRPLRSTAWLGRLASWQS